MTMRWMLSFLCAIRPTYKLFPCHLYTYTRYNYCSSSFSSLPHAAELLCFIFFKSLMRIKAEQFWVCGGGNCGARRQEENGENEWTSCGVGKGEAFSVGILWKVFGKQHPHTNYENPINFMQKRSERHVGVEKNIFMCSATLRLALLSPTTYTYSPNWCCIGRE